MLGSNDDPGIMPKTLGDLFAQIKSRSEDISCNVSLSYLEVKVIS